MLFHATAGLDGRPNLAVGSVLKAWQSDDGSVRVMCSIDHSTDLADHVRKNVLNRQLPDLSLSHSYEMFLDGNNKVALVKSPIEVCRFANAVHNVMCGAGVCMQHGSTRGCEMQRLQAWADACSRYTHP